MLAGGHADGIVVHPDRDAAVPVGQPIPERERPPGRNVQRRDQTRWPLNRTAAAAADPGKLTFVTDLGGIEHLGEQRLQGAPKLLCIVVTHPATTETSNLSLHDALPI